MQKWSLRVFSDSGTHAICFLRLVAVDIILILLIVEEQQ